MYKLMIVDDEEIILDGLKNVVEWENLGIEVISYAYNGKEALEKIAENVPDILITDISMPVMDGIELVRELRERGFDSIKIVFLSGYNDFEYARNATRLGAVDYLLKPTNPDNLEKLMKKIVNMCDCERMMEERERDLKKKLSLSMPLLKSRFLNEIISGYITSEEEIQETAKFLEINTEEYNYLVFTLNFEGFICDTNEELNRHYYLTRQLAYNVIQEEIEGRNLGIVINYGTIGIPVVLFLKEQDKPGITYEIIEIIKDVRRKVKDAVGLPVSIGVGNIYKNLHDIEKSYQESVKALQFRAVMGDDCIIYINDLNDESSGIQNYPIDKVKILTESIRFRNLAKVRTTLNEIFDDIRNSSMVSRYRENQVRFLLLSIYIALVESGANSDTIHLEINSMSSSCGFRDMDDLNKSIYRFISDTINDLLNQSSSKNRRICNDIIEYIKAHYNEEITLEGIAEKFYFTPNYLGNMFKKCVGKSFKEFLIGVRLEKAKELIRTNKYKFYEIGSMVGYDNYEYFRKLFRKYTGLNPSDFS